MASVYAASTSGPETFGDWILNHYNPALAVMLNPPAIVTSSLYALASSDANLIINAAAAHLLTLPASSLSAGRPLNIKTLGQSVGTTLSNVVPIGSTVAGSVILSSAAGKWAELHADGTNWVIMKSN